MNLQLWRSAISYLFCLLFVYGSVSAAQTHLGSITGVVADPSGAVIVGAKVSAAGDEGSHVALTDSQGRYNFPQLSPGDYQLSVSAPGFRTNESVTVKVASGIATVKNVAMEVQVADEQIDVGTNANSIDTEPTNNASALTLSGSALESLSDDPDDLAQDLQALAGPAAGPEGGEIFVDGFSGGKIPPKSSIREIRINQNPFSSEYDRLGFGRVEILTKPGTDKFRGETRFNFGDSIFNSQNPFAPTKPDYQRRMLEVTLSGPLNKKASYTFQFERRDIGQAALINALVLDSGFNIVPYKESISNPYKNTEISGRLDYQLSTNHTLVARYEWERDSQENDGLDTFSLPTRGYNSAEREHTFQLTETAILSPQAIHEIRFQYRRSHDTNEAVNDAPAINVSGAFTGGGTSMSLDGLTENRYEVQDLLSLTRGRHTLKLGGRFRIINEINAGLDNYNGEFTFASIDAYKITQEGLANGLTNDEIRTLGGGPSQFAITTGTPAADITMFDVGVFLQDDWRVRSDLTLSAGLRYENQTDIHDWRDWAPRVGLAWAIKNKGKQKPLAVLRAGYGIFYDRVRESLILSTKRLNGVLQQQFLIPNPDFYPLIPTEDTLSGFAQEQAIRVFEDGLRAPYTQQFALTLEREMLKNVTTSLTYTNSRGERTLRSRNVNAPLPETLERPLPGGNIYEYETNGKFRQNQLMLNVNARMGKRLNFFGNYTYGKAESDTDGAGSFPADTYNLAAEYGRAGFDSRHRAMVGGSTTVPFGFSLSPFIIMHSGGPFNIVVGQDLNGDSIFNDRPAWATALSRPSVVETPWGVFDTQPMPGQTIIPRNLGTSPGMFSVNLRVSRSFGFGAQKSSGAAEGTAGMPPPGGGPFGGGRPGGHGRGGPFGGQGESTNKKYSLTFSVAARNLFNRVNLNSPVGNLSSPLFGTSTSIHGFGPGGSSANRSIDLQTRFSF